MPDIYLDNNATTKIDDKVLEAMLPYLQELYGNPASVQYRLGRIASEAVEQAREQVANSLQVSSKEIFFNTGATESINTVLRGTVETYSRKGKHIITAKTEHTAVLQTCEYLTKKGVEVTYLSVNKDGEIDLNELKDTIRQDTILVCLMAANNETGLIHPIEKIASICQEKDTLYFCDATQLIGKQDINLQDIPIDILTFSAHKLHGPKGIGALYIRRKRKPIQIPSLISGGSQEKGFRAGTLNTPNIVGCGKAIEIVRPQKQLRELRDNMEKRIIETVPQVIIHAQNGNRLYNTSYISFRHLKSAEIMTSLPHIALSSGSACSAGLLDPSHVLKAMGLSDEDSYASIRISLSKYNDKSQIDMATSQIIDAVTVLRNNSPIWQLFLDGLID